MISVRQVRFVEEHWESIAKRALGRIRREIPQSASFSDAMILDSVQDLFGHLGDWLTVSNPEQMGRYEQFGRRRAAAHVYLHDLVRSLQIIRQCAVDYARDNELSENTVALRCESDLEYGIDRFFDLVVYNVVKGYEAGLREKPSAAAAAN
jgi:hypothetical protein